MLLHSSTIDNIHVYRSRLDVEARHEVRLRELVVHLGGQVQDEDGLSLAPLEVESKLGALGGVQVEPPRAGNST